MIQLYLIHFLLGLVASFLGTLPFGTINLSVVNTTINQSFRAGFILSVAAAIVEIIQSLIAFHCSVWISENIESNIYLQVFVVILFLAIGAYFFLRKPSSGEEAKSRFRMSNFVKGMMLGLFNPQALPFWVFVIAYFQSAQLIALDGMEIKLGLLVSFLAGVSIGKLGALTLYGALSVVVTQKISSLGLWMNKALGSIFIVLALIQGIKLF